MKSKRSLEGYLQIDHRESPGVPNEMTAAINAQLPPARAFPFVGPHVNFESTVVTCSHCHAIIILNPDRSRERHYCAKCDHYVCDRPSCVMECRPLNQLIDEIQEQAAKDLLIKEI